MNNRYQNALATIPPPGCGLNCHPTLLSVANYGVKAGVKPQQIHDDLRVSIPQGKRQITDRAITDAINKALSDHTKGTFTPQPRQKPAVLDGKAALQKIIDQGKISNDADLWEASPFRLWEGTKDDPVLLLETLYEKTDLIWIGERFDEGIMGETIQPVGQWIDDFKAGREIPPHIIPNPLTGTPAIKKTGDGETYRGDANVKEYRFCLVEFDDLPRESQIRFLSAAQLPIVCLIDSGGKSIHAWLQVSKIATVTTSDQWQLNIKQNLYDRLLTPLGADGACSNPARLSRLPGHFRTEKSEFQRLLWLSPEGRQVCYE